MEHKQSFFQRIGKDKRYIVFNLFFAYFTLGVALIMLGSVLPVSHRQTVMGVTPSSAAISSCVIRRFSLADLIFSE